MLTVQKPDDDQAQMEHIPNTFGFGCAVCQSKTELLSRHAYWWIKRSYLLKDKSV